MKSAIEKRDHAPPAKVEVLTESKGSAYPPGRMLVSSPLEVDAVLRRIPEGRVLTVGELRANLAGNHRADYTCPMTTGLFLRIVGEAAEEERAALGGAVTPYWRVVQDDGALLDKLPGGPEAQARRLSTEGVVLFHVGKLPRVSDVEHYAWHPPLLGKAAARRREAPGKGTARPPGKGVARPGAKAAARPAARGTDRRR